jgi:hypothetical protein
MTQNWILLYQIEQRIASELPNTVTMHPVVIRNSECAQRGVSGEDSKKSCGSFIHHVVRTEIKRYQSLIVSQTFYQLQDSIITEVILA